MSGAREASVPAAAGVGRLGIVEFDVVDGPAERYVVMEYVAGGTLEPYCRPGQLMAVDSAIDIVFKAAKALEPAWA